MENGRRHDFHVRNYKDEVLHCSLYTPLTRSRWQKVCVVYLHSMNGSRLECKLPIYISPILCSGGAAVGHFLLLV